MWKVYLTSGPDSGPPQGTYIGFLARSWSEATTWAFPLSGLVTALVNWLLARGAGGTVPAPSTWSNPAQPPPSVEP